MKVEILHRGRGFRSEGGFTLVELLVSMAILGTVLTSVYAVLASVQFGFERQIDRASSVDQARLAIEQIQHELLGAIAVTVPSGGLSMDAYTRTNETTRGNERCVQWKLQEGKLLARHWIPPFPDGSTPPAWRTVATDLTNDKPTPTPDVPIFGVNDNQAYANRIVDVAVLVNTNVDSGRDVSIEGSVFGRNISYGETDVCAIKQPGG